MSACAPRRQLADRRTRMDVIDLLVVALAVLSAALVQVVAGFGFALLAVPLMTLAIPTRDAVVVATLLGLGASTWQARHGRSDIDWRLARRLVISAYAGMPLGLLVFVTVDDRVLRLLLGIGVLLAVGLLAADVKLHDRGLALDVGCGFLSGVLSTSISTNGPPLVFALHTRQLAPPAFRSTITTVFALSNGLGLMLFIAAGKVTRDGLVAAGVAVPSLAVGLLLGFPLRRHIHGERFRRLVLVLLVVAAASAIAAVLR